jgi:hypothetical protein
MVVPAQHRFVEGEASVRIINVALGTWLFLSAFAWPHSRAQQTNTWIVGALTVAIAYAGMTVPWARYFNTVLAIWLFISAFVLPKLSVGTVWNNVLVAIAIFCVSLVPSDRRHGAPGLLGRTAPPRSA